MKSLYLSLILVFTAFCAVSAQEYRLSYDASSIPELYGETTVTLESRVGNQYLPYKGNYRLYSNEAHVSGRHITYDVASIQDKKGLLPFEVTVNGDRLPLVLQLPYMTDLRFNLYADSIKPVLNFYVNVEGIFFDGKIFPLTEEQVRITASEGRMNGMEWVVPKERAFDRVIFTATSTADPSIARSVTVYLKKYKDPRDAEGYQKLKRPSEPGRRHIY
jgi:hypothetical protein